jgi:Tfp pilus assembly protein PilF
MLRVGGVAGLALAVAACAATAPERLRDLNEDGVHLYQQGSYAQARASFQAALDLKPGDPSLLYNLGQCYDHLGQTERAEQVYRQILERQPNHAECRHALTALLVRTGRRPDAVRMVEDWLRRQPDLAAAYAEDGWLREQYGDLINARGRLQQALERDPHNNLALTELARIYEAMHRPDRAVVLYERALENNPHQPDVARRVSLLRSQGAGPPHPD